MSRHGPTYGCFNSLTINLPGRKHVTAFTAAVNVRSATPAAECKPFALGPKKPSVPSGWPMKAQIEGGLDLCWGNLVGRLPLQVASGGSPKHVSDMAKTPSNYLSTTLFHLRLRILFFPTLTTTSKVTTDSRRDTVHCMFIPNSHQDTQALFSEPPSTKLAPSNLPRFAAALAALGISQLKTLFEPP